MAFALMKLPDDLDALQAALFELTAPLVVFIGTVGHASRC